MSELFLADLNPDHPLRCSPLLSIGAEYKWSGGGSWKAVTEAYKIAGATYNDLGAAWVEHFDWRSTKETEDGLSTSL